MAEHPHRPRHHHHLPTLAVPCLATLSYPAHQACVAATAQDHRRMSPRTIVPAAVPPHLVSPSGAQDGIAAWKAPPSWVSGDQPEPDVSSSEDEKAPSSKRKSRRRATISRTLQSQSVESRNYKIRVYRTNTEYHILDLQLVYHCCTALWCAKHNCPRSRGARRSQIVPQGARERFVASSSAVLKPTTFRQQNACLPRPSDRQISYEDV
jgi:hypothetical protein